MPTLTINFDSYRIRHDAGPLASQNYVAVIECLAGLAEVVNLIFMKEGITPPQNVKDVNGVVLLYFPVSRFNDILNTIRYEKPLRCVFNSDSFWGYLETNSSEPTGEQEG